MGCVPVLGNSRGRIEFSGVEESTDFYSLKRHRKRVWIPREQKVPISLQTD